MLWGASVMGAGQAWQSHCRQAVPPWSTQTDWRTLPVLCVCVVCVCAPQVRLVATQGWSNPEATVGGFADDDLEDNYHF